MGAVYEALDNELNVAVALKVIRPEITADPAAARDLERRFKQELLLARQVTNKHVVRIHDLGEIDGIKYLTMTYVEGADLSTVLRLAGRLELTTALRLARHIATGLQAAHEAGVVHRDLKPANIMIDGDNAVIMDFGIARSAGAADGSMPGLKGRGVQVNATTVGAITGTVHYMAPEQARGVPADQRVDVYAFGLIFYDMLLGGRGVPGRGGALDELHRRMQQAPPPVRSIRQDVPEAVDAIVTKCLQPDPAARYQTSSELLDDLARLDDAGQPLPVAVRFTPRLMAAIAAGILAVVAATWWLSRAPAVPVQPDPLSVLIADFQNHTGDTVFEGSVEQALTIGLEGASFITAYQRPAALRLANQIKPSSKLDESVARLVSVREGIEVVIAGSIAASGSGYRISVKAIDPADGKELASAEETSRGKSEMLAAVGSLAEELRDALGDTSSSAAMNASTETFTSSSLDAIREYSIAQDLGLAGKDEDAIAHYRKAIDHDQSFGRAYSGWAVIAFRMGRRDEAEEAYQKALSLIDRMTDREKYRTLGTYYVSMARNYDKAIENYRELLKLYPADNSGHNGLANAYFNTLNFAGALDEAREALKIYSKSVLYRNNLALFAMYAGDFDTAAKEARAVIEQDPTYHKAYLALAMSALAAGDTAAAGEAYAKMQAAGPRGASLASLGLADLAMYHGQDPEAALKAGAVEDDKNKNVAGLASKQIALAEAYAASGRRRQAAEASETALRTSRQDPTLVAAANVLVDAGGIAAARSIAEELRAKFQPQSRAYASIIDGRIALAEGRKPDAISAFQAAVKHADLWQGRFMLGLAYIEAGHYAEGLSELEACMKRRGEATAVFLDDMPTFRRQAPVPYYLGRAQEALGMKPRAIENYNAYLALRANTPADPLAADARKRVGTR
jgi:tetratricopeptide (TPR) repeat protein